MFMLNMDVDRRFLSCRANDALLTLFMGDLIRHQNKADYGPIIVKQSN